MATTEKCFCHLNGYAVKDATARRDIGLLHNDLSAVYTNVGGLTTEVEGVKTSVSNLEMNVNAVGDNISDVDERVAALEQGGVKLYAHSVTFSIISGGDMVYLNTTFYRNSPEQLSSFTGMVNELIGNMTVNQFLIGSTTRIVCGMIRGSDDVLEIRYASSIDAATGAVTRASLNVNISNPSIIRYIVKEV